MKCKTPPEDTIEMRAVMFADGAKGAATQTWHNEEYGITCICTRPDRQTAFVQTWSATGLPNLEFKAYSDLRLAMKQAVEPPQTPRQR